MKSIFLLTFLLFSSGVFAERTHDSSSTSSRPTADNLRVRLNSNEPVDTNRIETLKGQLCGRDFDKTAWENALPRIDGEFSRTNAILYLLQFQKKNGFVPAEHLSILKAILRDFTFVRENLLLVDQALEGVHASHPDLYKTLLLENLHLFNLEHRQWRGENPQPQCRSNEENVFFKAEAEKKLAAVLAEGATNPGLDTWRPLYPLRTSLNQLTEEKKTEALHGIVCASANNLSLVPELHGLFESKVAKLALQPVAPIFGMKSKDITDLDAEANDGYVRVRALGTQPLPGGTPENKFGFYSRDLDHFRANSRSPMERKYEWQQKGQTYKGTVHAAPSTVSNLRKTETSLPYNDLWQDGKLSGIVIVGSNQDDESDPILAQYKAFYEGHGYSFPNPAENVDDLYTNFKEKLTSGAADYFVKEAHSDGEPLHLFEIATKGKILKGTKTHPDGKVEEVLLVYPTQGVDGKLISNQEFGRWIKSRDSENKGPLVYFNVSCWSASKKAPNELAAAGSNNLIEIPAITETDPLENKTNNALYQLMEGFLEKKNYNEMREKMKNDPYYVDKKWDWYILPDERSYEDMIWTRLKVPIDIQVDMTDPLGNPFRFGN